MGSQVDAARVGPGSRAAFRERLRQGQAVLAGMLADHDAALAAGARHRSPFAEPGADGAPVTGTEVECVLVADPARGGVASSGQASAPQGDWAPRAVTAAVLAQLGDPDVVPEIGAHTLELNVPPSTAAGTALAALESDLRARLEAADAAAAACGARVLLVGVLPTLLPEHLRGDWMTPSARFAALGAAVLAARGEDVVLDIEGSGRGGRAERLSLTLPSIAAEAACTSTQLHLVTSPTDFAATWNAAQLLAGPQLALAANSPFALGRRLWPETRVPLFTQAVDTRTAELAAQGVAPRVFAGSGWATGVGDLFAQDVAWFPPLLPQLDEADPVTVRAAGGVPSLAELCLHAGTVWRWNRAVYDVQAGRAHLRVENRVLPSGPTVVDTVSSAAVFYGAVRALVEDGPDPAVLLDGAAPAAAITACAREGLDAQVDWPGAGRASARAVLLEQVLPAAAAGLSPLGVPRALADRYLDIAAARAATGRTGAHWQSAVVAARQEAGADRVGALAAMLAEYAERQGAGDPVHTWPLPGDRRRR